MDLGNLTTKQLTILLSAALVEFIWVCLPGCALAFVATLIDAPSDGALGKQYGLFLMLAIGLTVTLLWAPTALNVSGPLMKKLIRRICGTGKEE